MQLIREEKINKIIKKQLDWQFDVPAEGLYLIEISARAKSWWQNTIRLTSFLKDDDLTVKIDSIDFPKLDGRRGLFDGEVAWNGNNLAGLKKTDVFLMNLKSGNHIVQFLADQKPVLESIKIYKIQNQEKISYLPESNNPAEDGNRRQWLTIVLADEPLNYLLISAETKNYRTDDDDIKLIIDGKIQENTESKSHSKWFWCGRVLRGNKKEFRQKLNLPKGLHYIELWADRSPRLEVIELMPEQSSKPEFARGRIALYPDITALKEIHLFSQPDASSEILATLGDGEKCEILQERVIGEWIEAKSYLWHKVHYKEKDGYILSSFVEIEGQERDAVIKKIKEKTRELGINENLVLALAGCESKYKVYAASKPYKPDDLKIGQGVFQLTGNLIIDCNDKTKPFYSPVSDAFGLDQNITAGIKYFKYLYQERYKGEKNEIEKAVAAYNAGPANVSKGESLDLSLYEEQTQKLVKCVLENIKRKKWRNIFWPSLFFLLIFVSGLGIWSLNQKDFFEPIVSESEYLTAQISHFPAVFWEKEKNRVIFFNSQKKIVRKIAAQLLNLDEFFQTPSDVRGWNSIHLAGEVIENPENVFYFLAATTWSCGANNCHWILYRFNAQESKLEIVDKDIFGMVANFYLSPNSQKLAFVSNVHGGFCDNGDYLTVIDLSNLKKEEVKNYIDNAFSAFYIKAVSWKNNQEIEFDTEYHTCLGSVIAKRIWRYNIEKEKLEQLKIETFNQEI